MFFYRETSFPYLNMPTLISHFCYLLLSFEPYRRNDTLPSNLHAVTRKRCGKTCQLLIFSKIENNWLQTNKFKCCCRVLVVTLCDFPLRWQCHIFLEINTPHMQGTAWSWKQRDTFLVAPNLRSDDCKEKLPFVGQKPQADPGSGSSWEVPQESKFNCSKTRCPIYSSTFGNEFEKWFYRREAR